MSGPGAWTCLDHGDDRRRLAELRHACPPAEHADRGARRRALSRARPPPPAGRARVHPRARPAGNRRPAAGGQCRAAQRNRPPRWSGSSPMCRSWSARRSPSSKSLDLLVDQLRDQYPLELAGASATPFDELERLTREGEATRYPEGMYPEGGNGHRARAEDHQELQTRAHFLTVRDIVRSARSKEILCQGRGSAANSAVCFCLGITEVDPSAATSSSSASSRRSARSRQQYDESGRRPPGS